MRINKIMKNHLLLILASSLLGLCGLHAQENAHSFINANNILSCMSSNGSLFNDGTSGVFIAPNVAGADKASTYYISNLYIAGLDDKEKTFTSYNYYNVPGDNSFQAGPINQSTGQIFELEDAVFNRVWSINRTDILSLKEDILDGKINQAIAQDILEWPAKGNAYFGDVFTNQAGAPFFDNNTDGVYNPLDGDHPIIGEDFIDLIPDQILFTIYNDLNPLMEDPGFGAEIHLTMYALQCEESEVLNHSVFTRHKIINRSGKNYSELYSGFYTDKDIGCYTDDYVGCSPENNLVYSYNADSEDGIFDGECPNGTSFLTQPPVQSLRVLNHEMNSYISTSNAFIGNLPPECHNAETLVEIYNNLKGLWRDGSPMVEGGIGFDPTSTDTVKFLFPGNPNNSNEWSMYNEQFTSGDRRGLNAHKHGSFNMDDIIIIDAVHTFNRKEGFDHIENVNFAIDQSKEIQNFYHQKFQNICTQNILCMDENCVYPGDVNNNEIVDRIDLMLHGIAYANVGEIFESPRAFISSKWDEFSAEDRSTNSLNGVNHIHADCNGDGIVDLDEDLETMHNNFGLRSRKFISNDIDTEPFPFSGRIVIDLPDVFNVDVTGTIFTGEIAIEDMKNFHSVSYVLEYDTNVFEPLGDYAIPSVAGISKPELGFQTSLADGKLLVVKGNTAIGIANIDRISDSVLLKAREGVLDSQTTIRISDILIADYAENFYTLEDVEKAIVLKGSTVSTQENTELKVKIFPNPISGNVYIDSDQEIKSYKLFSLNGVLIQSGPIHSNQFRMNVESALYVIRLYGNDGFLVNKKIAVFHD